MKWILFTLGSLALAGLTLVILQRLLRPTRFRWLAIPGSLVPPLLLATTLLHALGLTTTQLLVFNSYEESVTYYFNGQTRELAGGQAEVLSTSHWRTNLQFEGPDYRIKARLKPGQYALRLGDHYPLHLQERNYAWNDTEQRFEAWEARDPDRLLFDEWLPQGLTALDNCWDCCLLLPPGERPYAYLKPANKDKRLFLSLFN